MNDGYDSAGKALISDKAELGLPYTFGYAKLKRNRGLSIGKRANLFLSGGLYAKMYLTRKESEFQIKVEQEGFDLISFWKTNVFESSDILGLSDENLQKLREFSERLIYERIKKDFSA